MSDVKIELNLQGINEMMKSEEIQAHLQRAGEAVANAAGNGYAAKTQEIKTQVLNAQPGLTAGMPPVTQKDDNEDEQMRKWFGLK